MNQEAVFLAGGPGHLKKVAVRHGAAEVDYEGVTYRDTGRRWTGLANHGLVRKAGMRLFTMTGTLTIRHEKKQPRTGCA